MNIYKCLNDITKYIDDNLEEEIDYNVLARFMGVNVYTMQRLFTMIAGLSISEYIRKRRLSNAGYDLYENKEKIMDIAIKYQYDNATSFSRAFEKFHGIKPSLVTKETKLKNFPRIVFNEDIIATTELDYEIIELDELKLYGIGFETSNEKIGQEAPIFFQKVIKKYVPEFGPVKYGMITYEIGHEESQKYYCLFDKPGKDFEQITIPKSKWLRFRINSENPKEIQDISHRFYNEFLPSCKYNLKEIPELEYYHDDITDFLVAIY